MEKSNSSSFLEGLRGRKLSNSDLYDLLKSRTNQLDILYVKLFKDDLDSYLVEIIEIRKNQFSKDEIKNEIEKRKADGFKIPVYTISGMTNKKDFKVTNRYNIEELMFPFEFDSHYKLQRLIKDEILPDLESNATKQVESNNLLVNQELLKKPQDKIDSYTIGKHKFFGSQTEFMELIKSLIENENLRGIQKEIIKDLAAYFEIKINNPNQLIQDLKNRNNGSETIFLDKLKSSLLNHFKK